MRIRRLLVLMALIAALPATRPAIAAETGDAGARETRFLRVRITQEVAWGDLRMETAYAAVFGPGGKFRIEGKILSGALTGDPATPMLMTMASNGQTLKQVLQVHGTTQHTTCDLGAVRKELPDMRSHLEFDPRLLAELVRKTPKKRQVREERLDEQQAVVYEIPSRAIPNSVPIPGVAGTPRHTERFLVWMGVNGLPLRAETYGRAGRLLLRTLYRDFQGTKTEPQEGFQLQVPSGAVELDMTAMLIGSVVSDEERSDETDSAEVKAVEHWNSEKGETP